ncbi:TetR/AcrR family transcriptional regulator [Paenibacillus thiaminolyticus]|uniref:TetR/AcrR family transcriptional regulator n=1 Tax=Paenibacillus thiaminolyticus TaxID=49283 RepID=UPI002542FB98|nr:TetR/AcrR family transcriptional regulator [Paenibacillus thiaminolyticus]WII38270.1 TetR/AcrR family transcriptional regulator [Paenibacillus thiaminolyticus]
MKEKIMKHSIALFEAKGFSEASIQDIVDTLGVTKGTFYYYFASKEQLLTQIHLQYIDYMLEEQRRIIEQQDRSWREKLSGIILMMIRAIEGQGGRARIFFRELLHIRGDNLAAITQKRDRFRLNVQSVIERGMESGEFRDDLPADMMALSILGACNWGYTWFKPDGPLSDAEVAAVYTELFLNGLSK